MPIDKARKQRLEAVGPDLAAAARFWGIPTVWLLAIARQESDFIPDAECTTGGDGRRGGSYGLCAMSLQTAHEYEPSVTPDMLKNAWVNASIAARHIARLADRFGKHNLQDVAAAYNSGCPLAVAPKKTRDTYVPHVLGYAALYNDAAKALDNQTKGPTL